MRESRWAIILFGSILGVLAGYLFFLWWRKRGPCAQKDTLFPPPAGPGILLKPTPPANSEPAKAGTEVSRDLRDDLARIVGIGPKIASVLEGAGIMTFPELAQAEVGRLKGILEGAGLRLADPGTWPEQARLAAAGRWDELEAFHARWRETLAQRKRKTP